MNPNLNIYAYPNEPNPNGHLYFVSLSFSLSGWVNICWCVWASLIVSMCVPVCLAVECVEQALCIEFLSMFGRPLAPRPAGPSSPSPRAPTPSLSRSSSFSFPHSLVRHVASCILHDQVLYLDLCKCHSHKYQYMFCSIFSKLLLLRF